ncbi:hypothetical protein [Pedobacter miscanthi]|jgi:hypothetical protein|uniref:hypothetical protein n=1 Tax=Pedobacter miscanthi TaxID=2259170 RepID=UPI00292E82A0|nr:hypothetical protein [Pedobacter miscanthi]
MASTGQEEQIRQYLQQRTSALSVVKVSNPDFQSLSVYAVITNKPGYEFSAVQQALNIYLSPWIKNTSAQVEIYQIRNNQTVVNMYV